MKNLVLAVLSLALLSYAQPGNYTGWSDTVTFTNFKADSVKYGRPLWFGTAENKILICQANDTNSAGAAADSIKFVYGYQRGVITINASAKPDTSWRNLVIADTFSTQAADTGGKWLSKSSVSVTNLTTGQETWIGRMLDSSNVTGYTVASAPIVPVYSPLVRYFIKGIAPNGNRIGGWIKVRMLMQSRLYVNTHGM